MDGFTESEKSESGFGFGFTKSNTALLVDAASDRISLTTS